MKNKKYLKLGVLFLIAFISICISCTKKSENPIAGFIFSGSDNLAPCSVKFTNSSQYGSSYSWDFGDGLTTDEASPTHVYQTDGVFTVKLIATGTNGTSEVSKTLNVINLSSKLNGNVFKSIATASIVSGTNFIIEVKDLQNLSNVMKIQFVYDSLKVKQYKFADLANFSFHGDKYAFGSYVDKDNRIHWTDSTSIISDWIRVTKFDKSTKKISGTFQFTGIEQGGTGKAAFASGNFVDIKWQ